MTMDTTALSHQMFDQLFRQNRRQLFIVAFSYVRDEDVAQDIVNDSFMSLWERRGSIEPINLKAYLFTDSSPNLLVSAIVKTIISDNTEKISFQVNGLYTPPTFP